MSEQFVIVSITGNPSLPLLFWIMYKLTNLVKL